MPKVEIGTAYGVTIRIEANEASVEELRKQAMDSFREACEIERGQPTGPAGGVQVERRGTPSMGFGTHWSQPDRWIGSAEVTA